MPQFHELSTHFIKYFVDIDLLKREIVKFIFIKCIFGNTIDYAQRLIPWEAVRNS